MRLLSSRSLYTLLFVQLLVISSVWSQWVADKVPIPECSVAQLHYSTDAPTQFSNPDEHKLTTTGPHILECVDGRASHGILGTPGGDSGEFMLAITALDELLNNHALLTPENVEYYFRLFVAHLAIRWEGRRFYLHSDSHTMERLFEELEIDVHDAEDEFKAERDLSSIESTHREKALELLIKPEFTGCGHMRLMMTYPEQYGTRVELTRAFIAAFYSTLWEQGELESALHHRIDEVVVLMGEHRENCVWKIDVTNPKKDSGCALAQPLIVPYEPATNRSCFILHSSAPDEVRDALSIFLHALAGSPTKFSIEQLRARIDVVAARHLNATLSYLAEGMPRYALEVELKPKETFSEPTPTNASSTNSIVWIIVGAVLLLVGVALVIVAVVSARKASYGTPEHV